MYNNYKAKELLQKYFGYSSFRQGQEEIITNILDGKDVLAVMPTGAGKSICYQIPTLIFNGITIVISPLISLMTDQVAYLNNNGIRAAYFNSLLTPRQMYLAMENAKRGVYKIIYVAPERLFNNEFINFAISSNISLIAVDEAHCISQWGHDFRPSYTKIFEFIASLPKRPIIAALTATATNKVKEDICNQLKLINPFTITTGFDRKNLYFGVERPFEKIQFVVDYIRKNPNKSGIIYCATRKNTDKVYQELNDLGINCGKYHAGMNDKDRQENQKNFIYDNVRVIAATTAFGMGINKPNVDFVIHLNMPMNIEQYYQEAGRAGRAGQKAECILLYCPSDIRLNQFLIEMSAEKNQIDDKAKKEFINKENEKLKLMTFYTTSKTICLRKTILNYFGEKYPSRCENCSVCLKLNPQKSHIDTSQYISTTNNDIIDKKLYKRLEHLRLLLSQKNGVPPYIIFSNRTLEELIINKPVTILKLRDIYGMSALKCDRYGNSIIKEIKDYLSHNS